MVVLGDDVYYAKAQKQLDDQDKQKMPAKSFIRTYLIKDPATSKTYVIWEVLWLLVLIVEFALVPYT